MKRLETSAARADGPAPSLPLPLKRLARATLAALTVEMAFVPAALAQTLIFGATGGGGSGDWDTTTQNWFDGSAAVPWTQGNRAIFDGVAGTVTLGQRITAQDLTFAIDGYVVTGNRLTLGSSGPAIVTLAPGVSAAIGSIVDGTRGLTVTGGGTLFLSSANAYRGGTTVSQGTLVFGANSSLGTGTVTLGDASTGAASTSLLATFGNYTTGRIRNGIVVSPVGSGTVAIGTAELDSGFANATIFNGQITLGRDVTLVGGSNDRTSFEGRIRGTGNVTITGHRVTWTNRLNDFVGSVTVTSGATLQTDAGSVLPASSSLNLEGNAVLQLAFNGNQVIDALTGSADAFVRRIASNPVSLTVGSANGSGDFAGTIEDALSSLVKVGTGTQTLLGANLYAGTTVVSGGVLSTPRLANGGAASGIGSSGNAAGNLVLNGGALQYTGGAAGTDRLFTLTTNGGGLDASGSGLLTFSNTGAVALSGSGARNFALTGTHTGINTLAAMLGDSGGPTSLMKSGTGTWALTGPNTYSGGTTVMGGRLNVNGDQSAATGAVSVGSGATLGGTGTIGGDVLIADGAMFAPGNPLAPGTLRINGDLALSGGSLLSYQLGESGITGGALNDLTVVNGNLVLDGTLNVAVTSGGSFDPGIYRLFNYAGALTNNGLTVASVPTPDYFLQTAVPNQINLINTAGLSLTFWDGGGLTNRNNDVIEGGDGAWQSSASAVGNWTTLTGGTNAPWTDGAFAIFEGAPGTVTVDNSAGQVSASGMHFAVDGYTLDGEPLTLSETNAGTGQTTIRVGDNTSVGTIDAATISVVLQGGTGVVKTDLGALILSGANTYAGGTAINGGMLRVANDGNLGAASGALSFNGGALATTASFGSARSATLNAAGGTLDVAGATTLVLGGVIGGAGALMKSNTGTLLLTGPDTYAGGTTIAAGTLQVGDGGTTGSIVGNVTNAGTLLFKRSDTLTQAGVISGAGALGQIGTGTTILTGANTYTGATTIGAGTLQLGNGGTSGSVIGNVMNNGTLAFNRGDAVSYAGIVSGTGALHQIGSGTTILTGANTYSGETTVTAGRLNINGDQSAATGAVSVASGATLGGTGTIGGDVAIADGAMFAPGNPLAPGTLTLDGDLVLASSSTVSYQLGEAGVTGGALNDLTVVNGNLTLDGTLNIAVTSGGSFDPGIYRLFEYAGALSNNGLSVGSVPTPDYFLQTAVPNQINLINTAGLSLNFWDGGALANRHNGVIEGGDGAWQSSASAVGNWTTLTGDTNAPWTDAAFAIFQGAPGTVTVDNSVGQVVASGMHLAVGGYTIDGEPLTLTETNVGTGQTTLRVGGAATIGAVLQGSTQVVKTDFGTLLLTGANTYTGGTAINGGVLRVGSDGSLGAASGALRFNGGTLATSASFGTSRATTLGAGGGTFDVANATTLTLSAAIDGVGALAKSNSGTLLTTGANTYTGGTRINSGTLQLGNGGASGSVIGNVMNNGTLAFNRSDALTLTGVISGTGALSQIGAGTTVLTAANTYSGGTTITAGTLQLGNGGTSGSVIGNVTNHGTLAFNRSDTVTYAGLVSGTGALTQSGPGTTTLTGANTYSGGTAINGGTLEVANDSNLGAASGALRFDGGVLATTASFSTSRATTLNTNGGSFDVGSATTFTLSGAIDGNGALGQIGAGTTILTGVNTYSGGTTVAAGTLQIGDGGTSGSIVGDVTNEGTLAFARSDIVTYAGVVSGLGTVEQRGSGKTTLTGANTYEGGTIIAAGTLQIGDGGTSGNIVGDVANEGALAFARGDTVTYGGIVSGAGALDQIGSGTTILTGANTYEGLTTITAGTLQLGNAGTSGSIAGNVVNNGTLGFNRSDIVTYAGAISGSGTVNQIGSGTTILTGTHTYTGGTALDGGTLEVGSDGNLGAASGALRFDGGTLATSASFSSARTATLNAAGGTFDVAAATTLTLSGATGGAGALRKSDTGTLLLTGTNTYSGGTTIAAGTLQIGNGGASGTISGNVVNNGMLVFNRSGISTHAGVISGSGGVNHIGIGMTILSATNTYAGATTIGAGTLVVNGSTRSAVTVSSGGTLGGIGTIDNRVNVTAGGTLAPGNSIGTLTVAGDLTLGADSTYRVETDPNGTSDRINVTGGGRATLEGGAVDVRGGNGTYTRDITYPIVNAAGGITGTFGSVTSDLAFLEASLGYDPNNVFLTLERNEVAIVSVASTSNQRSVGNYLDERAGDPGVRAVVARIEGLTADRARVALRGLTGDALSPPTTVALAEGRRFLDQLMGRSQNGGAGTGLAFSGVTMVGTEAINERVDRGRGFWVDGAASNGEVESDGNASGFDWHAGAINAGFDAETERGAVLGAALGYGRSSIEVEVTGESTIESPRAAFYGRTDFGQWQVRGAVGYADEDIDTRRFINIGVAEPSFAEVSRRAIERSATAEAEYDVAMTNGQLKPLVGVRYLRLDEHGFTETGSNASLTVDAKRSRSEEALLGLRYVRPMNAGAIRFEARGIWGHDFGDTVPTVTGRIATALSPATFTVAGVPVERDALTLGAGFLSEPTSKLSYYGDFAVELRGSGQTQYGFLAGLRLTW